MRYMLLFIISLILILLCSNPSSDTTPTKLKISAGNDTTIVGNDTISFLGIVYETNVAIETFNWFILSTTRELVSQKQQLEYIVPDSLCTLSFVFQVKTVNGIIQEDTVNYYVTPHILIVNAGDDQIALTNSLIAIHAKHTGDVTDSTFWKIGTGPFIPASPETTIVTPGKPILLSCIFKIKSGNKEVTDTINIDVISLDSLLITVNAGDDISAMVSSQIKLQGTYKGAGNKQIFWKIGTSPFVLASPDTILTLPDTPATIKCIFKVKNKSSEDSDTININVIANELLKAHAFKDTTVQPGSQLKISGSYIGRVMRLFWKIGNSPFVQASPETTITVPNTPMLLRCIFKVQDLQMNEALDTAIVTITPKVTSLQANAGNDQYVSTDSVVQLKGLGYDPVDPNNTIVKYEWKYGKDSWKVSPEGKEILEPQVPGLIVCSLRVTAKDSQVAMDFCIINVSSTIEMILIPAKNKTFKMGNKNHDQASPAHNVTFTKNFFMSKTEITQKEFVSLLNMNPSSVKRGNYPVYNCNWFDAVYYCNAKSKQENLDTVYTYSSIFGTIGYMCFMKNVKIDYTKKGYRLPTEAEWEFACRAGTTTNFYWGDVVNGNYLWYKDNSSSEPKAVGKKLPNAFGLYDMSGNVREWCNDWFSPYTGEGKIDPKGPENSQTSYKIVRNGSYNEKIDNSASFIRNYLTPRTVSRITGFRVVCDE